MKPFPEDYQFLEFFASEPELYDPDVPWFYNHLCFRHKTDNELVTVDIEPAYNEFKISWFLGEQLRVNLNINNVKGIEIEGSKAQTLIVSFHEAQNVSLLKLRLYPYIQIEWGTEKEQ
jgi:hypothetical protein